MIGPTPAPSGTDCTARIYGCPATPDWSAWHRAQTQTAGRHVVHVGTTNGSVAIVCAIVGALLILLGVAWLLMNR